MLYELAQELCSEFGDRWWELPPERRDRWIEFASYVFGKVEELRALDESEYHEMFEQR